MDRNLCGSKFGSWLVIGRQGRHAIVRCVCGNTSRVLPFDLRSGKSSRCKSCAGRANTKAIENLRGMNSADRRRFALKHGLADSPTQRTWSDMKRRCYATHRKDYQNYGARGIRVCDRWLNGSGSKGGFECFVEDMGMRPSVDYQIERINNDGDYEPNNCRWIPRKNQNYNKRNTKKFFAFGEELTMESAVSKYGIPYGTLLQRLTTHKMPPEVALTRPIRKTRASPN